MFEYYTAKWGEDPSNKECREIARIISWNLWQMDGLTMCLPFSVPPVESEEEEDFCGSFTDDDEQDPNQEEPSYCRIYDWRRGGNGYSILFKDIRKSERSKRSMKFDFVIGNPPYQEKSIGEKKADESIYPYFMKESFKIANKVEVITPARFLSATSGTLEKWKNEVLSDPHIKILHHDIDAGKYFPSTDIKGGIAITYRDANADFGALGVFTSFPELNSILLKVRKKKEKSLTEVIFNQNLFDLESLYMDFPELSSVISSGGREKRLTSGCMDYPCFHEQKEDNDIEIVGLISVKRVRKFINKKYIVDDKKTNLKKYKVILPANNGSGAIGEVLSTPLIGEPLIGFTQTFISIGSFDSREEVESAFKYVKSKFARAMLGILKVTQNGKKPVWQHVPLQNFTPESDIDWSGTVAEIDRQLYKKYGLTQEEIDFIESTAKEMV